MTKRIQVALSLTDNNTQVIVRRDCKSNRYYTPTYASLCRIQDLSYKDNIDTTCIFGRFSIATFIRNK